jgi:hypothetical protein
MAADHRWVLLLCSLFNDAVNKSEYTISNDWIAVNDELKGMWKDARVA